ncbi:HAD family hydrolase [Anatilimnocola floriformis]|uniref:HAD family hydrolase n=1 Tax=Anatilimnocola floriformis TaxID=2948575 RepID=UPI0020C2809D|nr:HAD-IA family hydrolase [Anatilimnocola floriformis]
MTGSGEVQALIFDCDGTLTDSMPIHYRSWRATMLLHGIDFAEDRFYALGGVPSKTIIEMLAAEKSMELNAAAVADQKEAAFLDLLHELQPLAHILDIARQNRGKLKMAVASGGTRPVILAQLEHIGCADWFDTIVTAEDTTRHKPDPDCFLEAARRLGVPPAECRVYEDADLGIEAARRAGMQCVDVRKWPGE